MQSSNSFSDSRSGRKRPTNILSGRPAPSESLPWPSPSFDLATSPNVGADPGRPSTQIRNGSLPPTPLTASYQKLPSLLPAVNSLSLASSPSKNAPVKLPGVEELVAQTPPPSVGLFTRELPLESPIDGPSSLLSSSSSSSSQPNTADLSMPGTMQASASRRSPMPLTREQFNNIVPASETVCGLGLELGEETPRLGDLMSTPRMNTVRRGTSVAHEEVPRAPLMASNETGRFPSNPYSAGLVSPVQPPLRNWNTDLFSESMACPRPPPPRRSLTAGSAEMERERTIQIEGELPMGHKLWGLGISFDEGRTFKRGRDVYDGEGKLLEEGSKNATTAVFPPTPTQQGSAKKAPRTAERPTARREGSSSSVASMSSTPVAATSPTLHGSAMRATKSTGLTPHVHKTRLTPTVAASRKANSSPGTGAAGDAGEIASPSLKMKSKQRSELLRSQVAAVTKANNLASDYTLASSSSEPSSSSSSFTSSASSSSSSTTTTSNKSKGSGAAVKVRRPKTGSPGKVAKRGGGLKVKDGNIVTPQSPWGVFELGGSKAWQPLGAPSMKDSIFSSSTNSSSTNKVSDDKGKAPIKRQQLPTDRDEIMSPPMSTKSSLSASSDVFGGSRPNSAGGARQSSFGPQRQQQPQRRTVNLR